MTTLSRLCCRNIIYYQVINEKIEVRNNNVRNDHN